MKECYYIAEINLPNKSAYAVHVMQMCNALSKLGNKVTLIVPYANLNILDKIKKNFAISNSFKIKSIFKDKKKLNFFFRIYFALSCLRLLKDKKQTLIISRSIISSIILAKKKIFNYLELHHELKGMTKLLYWFYKDEINYNLKYILISKYLLKIFNLPKKKYLILDDAVNIDLFKNQKVKKLINTCAYFGSLTKGKGIEIITKTAKETKNINFHVYGDLGLMDLKIKNSNKNNNLKFFNYSTYEMVPKLMSKYEVVLMPYLKNVRVRSNNLDTAKYMSPLKLFEYLAMSKIILATKLSVYSHILKNNENSILIPLNKTYLWKKNILKIFNNRKKFDYLKKNAKKTALKYTWDLRVKKIIKDYKNVKLN